LALAEVQIRLLRSDDDINAHWRIQFCATLVNARIAMSGFAQIEASSPFWKLQFKLLSKRLNLGPANLIVDLFGR
jgi:hypothetical protein